MRLPPRLAALHERNYRLLVTGQVLSQLGDQMTPVAMSFAVLDRGGSARQVGYVLGSGTATMVLFLLIGGMIADRLPRRSVMLGADLLRCGVQGGVAALLLAGHWELWQLVALEAGWGLGAAFFNPALTGLVPELLSGDLLVQGNALQSLTGSFGVVVGPALAGVLVAAGGAGSAIAVDAASFAVSAFNLARIRLSGAPSGAPARRSLVGELVTGWREFRSRRWLWGIVLEFSLWHLVALAPLFVLGTVVAKERLGGAAAWGTILSSFGVGTLAGGVLSLHWRPARPLLTGMLGTLAFAPLPALLALGSPVAAIAPVALVSGAGFAVFDTQWNTTMQREIPPEVLSRVSAYDWLGSLALLPVGYVIAGPIAGVIGVAAALWSSAAFSALAVGAVLLIPEVRRMRAGPLERVAIGQPA